MPCAGEAALTWVHGPDLRAFRRGAHWRCLVKSWKKLKRACALLNFSTTIHVVCQRDFGGLRTRTCSPCLGARIACIFAGSESPPGSESFAFDNWLFANKSPIRIDHAKKRRRGMRTYCMPSRPGDSSICPSSFLLRPPLSGRLALVLSPDPS